MNERENGKLAKRESVLISALMNVSERPFETMQYRSTRRRDESAVHRATPKPFDPLADFLNLFGLRTHSDSTPKLVPRKERPPPPRFDPIGDLLNLAGVKSNNSTVAPSLEPRSKEKKTPLFDPIRDLMELPMIKEGTEQALSTADSVRKQLEEINPLPNLFSPAKIIRAEEVTTTTKEPRAIVPINGVANLVLSNDASSPSSSTTATASTTTTKDPRDGLTRLNSALETDIRKMFPPLFNILDNIGVPERQDDLHEIQIGRDRTVTEPFNSLNVFQNVFS